MNYLSPAEILYIHSRVTDVIGAKHGMSDLKVLKKAVAYTHNSEMFPDRYSKAAGLLFAISRKKPFSGSNLPTAFMATQVFLYKNGIEFDISNPEVPAFSRMFLPTATLNEIKSFISQNSVVAKPV